MKNLNVMLKPASSLCNLRCEYCFYADVAANREIPSYGIMKDETAEAIVKNLFGFLEKGDTINIAFQGGEPTCAGFEWFRRFVSLVKKYQGDVRVTYALQTNATLINEDWFPFLKEYGFLLGVSLDGTEEMHNANRIDAQGKGTFKAVMKTISGLNRYGIEYNVLMTLTNNMARHPDQIWKFILKNNLRYVQFTPCLDDLDAAKKSPYAITPARFASFYIQIFDLWKREFARGNYFSVKLFDDLINLLAFGQVNACGLIGKCSPQIVIEADGGLYPCDFYMLDQWKIGNAAVTPLKELYMSPKYAEFLNRPRERKLCADCAYGRICNGCCARMQSGICYAENDGSCGYREFLDHCIRDMSVIAENERRARGGRG